MYNCKKENKSIVPTLTSHHWRGRPGHTRQRERVQSGQSSLRVPSSPPHSPLSLRWPQPGDWQLPEAEATTLSVTHESSLCHISQPTYPTSLIFWNLTAFSPTTAPHPGPGHHPITSFDSTCLAPSPSAVPPMVCSGYCIQVKRGNRIQSKLSPPQTCTSYSFLKKGNQSPRRGPQGPAPHPLPLLTPLLPPLQAHSPLFIPSVFPLPLL